MVKTQCLCYLCFRSEAEIAYRCLPHEGKAEAVLPVGDLLWRAVHGSGQRQPACGLRREENPGESHSGEVPTTPQKEERTARSPRDSPGTV